MTTGIKLIAKERKRQIEKEGWSAEHDSQHKDGEIAIAASCYAMPHNKRKYRNKNQLCNPFVF